MIREKTKFRITYFPFAWLLWIYNTGQNQTLKILMIRYLLPTCKRSDNHKTPSQKPIWWSNWCASKTWWPEQNSTWRRSRWTRCSFCSRTWAKHEENANIAALRRKDSARLLPVRMPSFSQSHKFHKHFNQWGSQRHSRLKEMLETDLVPALGQRDHSAKVKRKHKGKECIKKPWHRGKGSRSSTISIHNMTRTLTWRSNLRWWPNLRLRMKENH